MASANGAAAELAAAPELPPGMLRVPVEGKPAGMIIPAEVAVYMLAKLFERDDKQFVVLLGEGFTGVRLAKTLSRDQPDSGPRPGPEDRKLHAAPQG